MLGQDSDRVLSKETFLSDVACPKSHAVGLVNAATVGKAASSISSETKILDIDSDWVPEALSKKWPEPPQGMVPMLVEQAAPVTVLLRSWSKKKPGPSQKSGASCSGWHIHHIKALMGKTRGQQAVASFLNHLLRHQLSDDFLWLMRTVLFRRVRGTCALSKFWTTYGYVRLLAKCIANLELLSF